MLQEILFLVMVDDGARERLMELIKKVKGDRDQRKFAKDTGVSLGAVQGWLKGKIPRSDNLQKIAIAAGMSVDELLAEVRGEGVARTPKVAEEVLQAALQLDEEEQRRLIKLLVNRVL
jgi:transcriptional regulator with XRE-family HTH domain